MIRKTTAGSRRRQRKRSERTEEILDCAMSLVSEGGLGKLTMPRLAREADAAVGALYRYFPSKDAVIAGLQLRAVRALQAFVRQQVGAGPPLARVVRAASSWERFRQQEPVLYRLVDLSLSDPQPVLTDERARQVEAEVRAALAPLIEALGDAVGAGQLEPGDATARATAVWVAMHGLGHFRKRDRLVDEAYRADLIGKTLLSGLLVGWGAVPEAVDQAWDDPLPVAHGDAVG